jgi:sodium transport system permease protein
MNWHNTFIVFRKELLDTLRDRRTWISSILVPVLLFPVLFLGIGTIAYHVIKRATAENPAVMLLGAQNGPRLAQLLGDHKELRIVPESPDYVKQIDEKKLRAAIEFPAGFEENIRTRPAETQTVRIYFFDNEVRSEAVVREIQREIEKYRKEIVEGRLSSNQLVEAQVVPFRYVRENVAAAERVIGNILGFLLPYMAIVLCYSGAMYPAMDLTAGEKERGTIETLLVSPVRRTDLVIGKTLLVILTAVFTTALSITSMGVTAALGVRLLRKIQPEFVFAINLKSVALAFLMILPLAVIFSAALVAISLYARNYREAQSYGGQLIFIEILPAVASMIPNLQLTPKLALIPILNVSLVMKDIFAGQYPWGMIGLIFLSTAVIAGLMVALAVRQFHREEVLFRT